MLTRPPFDSERSFTAWLERDAHVRPPEALLERVLSRTAATRRRPGWLIIERWFPMDKTARFGAIPAAAILLALLGLLLLGLVGATVVGSQPSAVPSGPGAFTPGPSLETGRISHRATLLPDGRVLVVGGGAGEAFGEGDGPAGTAELWDPATMRFIPAGSLIEPRLWHTATLLTDGRVLVVGGIREGPEAPLATAELWDPATSTFSPAASLAVARTGHSATLMPDGRLLVVGGSGEAERPLASTEVWEP